MSTKNAPTTARNDSHPEQAHHPRGVTLDIKYKVATAEAESTGKTKERKTPTARTSAWHGTHRVGREING